MLSHAVYESVREELARALGAPSHRGDSPSHPWAQWELADGTSLMLTEAPPGALLGAYTFAARRSETWPVLSAAEALPALNKARSWLVAAGAGPAQRSLAGVA